MLKAVGCSKAVVWLLVIYCCSRCLTGYALSIFFWYAYFVSFLFCIHLAWEERNGCFSFLFVLMTCGCYRSLYILSGLSVGLQCVNVAFPGHTEFVITILKFIVDLISY